MTDRVRAILITSDRQLATIKRIKPGRPAYWVLPGGGVEPGDATLEDALHREIREELGGTITVRALVAVVDHGRDRHHIYLADLLDHHPDQRTGPELTEPGHGQYLLDLIPLTPGVLASITLLPPQIAELLRHCLDHGSDLSALPDLRTSTRIRPPSQSS